MSISTPTAAKAALVLALVAAFAATASASETIRTLGPVIGNGTEGSRENPCPPSALMLNADATLENAYGWAYGGVALPDYGSVAERYSADGTVCGIELFLSTLPGYFQDQSMDLYIWDSDGQFPNNVLAVSTGVHISTPDFWPAVSTFDLPLQETEVSGEFFIGYWGNWPGQLLGWYIAADIDGPGGYPVTKVAPGIGLPTGWIEVPRVWGTTQALGIGAWISGIPNPAERTSWGAIKGLYK